MSKVRMNHLSEDDPHSCFYVSMGYIIKSGQVKFDPEKVKWNKCTLEIK